MIQETDDLAYAYALELCQGIEKLTEKRQSENRGPDRDSLYYRGSNLRYALERALYTSYLNNKTLFGIYDRYKKGTSHGLVEIKDPLDLELALTFGHIDVSKIKIVKPPEPVTKRILKMVVKPVAVFLRLHTLSRVLRQYINTLKQRGQRPEIIISVQSERFARYLEPIVKSLTKSYSFLTYNTEAYMYARKGDLPVILVSRFGYFLERWATPDGLLKRFSLTERYDLLEDSLRRLAPRQVVVVEGNASGDEIANRICKKYDIPSICIQHGWSPMIHNGFRNMTYDKFLTWGKGFGELLQSSNPKEHFIATGSYNINVSDAKKQTTISSIALFCQGVTRILNQHAWNELLRLAYELRKSFPAITVIIREHPSDPIDKYDNTHRARLQAAGVIFMSGPKYSLDEVLDQADLSVSIFSTTILESVTAGVLPIIMNVTSYPTYFPDVDALGAGIETKNVEETLKVIGEFVRGERKVADYSGRMRECSQRFFAASTKTAIENIVREIENPYATILPL